MLARTHCCNCFACQRLGLLWCHDRCLQQRVSDDLKCHMDCKPSAVHWRRDEASKAAHNLSTSEVDPEGMACIVTAQPQRISMDFNAAIDRAG